MAYAYTYTKDVSTVGLQSPDRIIELKAIDGKGKDVLTGNVDKRLFSGENRLHAIQDAGLWYLKYDKGALPEILKQRFTGFNILLKYVTEYFNKRNVEVKEIKA